MIRGYLGNGFSLSIAGLKTGDTKIEHYTNKDNETITEYWVYRRVNVKTSFFNSKGGRIYKAEENSRLFCIITCDNDKLLLNKEKGLVFVQGIRFTGNDINEYLRKTKRHVDNIMLDSNDDDIRDDSISKIEKKNLGEG